MNPPPAIEAAARARIARCQPQAKRSIRYIRAGNPLGAEGEPGRLQRRIMAKARLTVGAAAALVQGIGAPTGPPAPVVRPSGARARRGARAAAEALPGGPERIYGTIDFVGISFLERGLAAARAVARVAFRDGRPQGSGFLVSDRLFLTNNHVIATPAEAARFVLEFDYELGPDGIPRPPTRFALDPGLFFVTSGRDDLDFTLLGVGSRLGGRRELDELGACPLSDARDKHALGEWANIVQHPDGRYKEVVLRENRLVARLDTVLHYVADTEPGSSGSPVFNNEWQVIALHHWGGPWRQTRDEKGLPLPTEINEGIRTSAIVKELKTQAGGLRASERALLEGALAQESAAPRPPAPRPDGRSAIETRVAEDGSAVWRVPLEISVRLPGAAAAAPGSLGGLPRLSAVAGLEDDPLAPERAVHIDRNYDNRPGYRPAFLGSTHRVEPPRLAAALLARTARNREAQPGDDPFELKYQHFSVVIDKKRRLARYTACNVDGRSSKDVDRKTGVVSPRRPSGGEAAEGAEASEQWFADDRLDADAQTHQDLYDGQEVPGFPNKRTRAWQNRMFQRGHLVRRTDPAWGTDARALRADADTFHFANCTPQVGFFNMGTAPAGTPDSGGGRLWRAIEDHVLDNAVDEQKRVSVFTGPVLDDQGDPKWREHVIPGFRVPLRFWKIVVWVESGKLRALAMLADQEPVIEVMPEALERGEAFTDTSKVRDFVVTVAEVERLTGLTFDDAVRAADVSAGEARRGARGEAKRRGSKRRAVTSFEEIGLSRS